VTRPEAAADAEGADAEGAHAEGAHAEGADAEDKDRTASEELGRLGELVATLRERCPWDRRQTHLSLAPHLLEESYEATDAIEALAREQPEVRPGVVSHLEEELGDVLFQVFFHCELASEEGWVTLSDVARTVHDKLVSRHPHVFGDASADSAEEVAARWEVLKRSEKKRRGITDTVPDSMPALALVTKLLKRASSSGMELPPPAARGEEVAGSLELLLEHLSERAPDNHRVTTETQPEMMDAVGEALLALADLSRRIGVDPELALRSRAVRVREEIEAADRADSRT
jgi:tetrapyrrole methylase family protein / MazG family protein